MLARQWWLLELTTHFMPYYSAALVLGSIGWAVARRRNLMVLCVASLAATTVPMVHHWWPLERVPSSDARLRVMTLNVLTANAQHDSVLALIKKEDPDLLLLVEVDQQWIEALAPLAQRYPSVRHLTRKDNFGVAFYSKLPAAELKIRSVGVGDQDEGVPAVFAKLTWQAQPLYFVGAHTLPPSSARYAQLRNRQLMELADYTKDLDGRIIVAGDLNVTPYSPYFVDLLYRGKLVDSSVGFGLQPTWTAGRGVIRIAIDHVLHNQPLIATARRIGPHVGSDHRAVIVDFSATNR